MIWFRSLWFHSLFPKLTTRTKLLKSPKYWVGCKGNSLQQCPGCWKLSVTCWAQGQSQTVNFCWKQDAEAILLKFANHLRQNRAVTCLSWVFVCVFPILFQSYFLFWSASQKQFTIGQMTQNKNQTRHYGAMAILLSDKNIVHRAVQRSGGVFGAVCVHKRSKLYAKMKWATRYTSSNHHLFFCIFAFC